MAGSEVWSLNLGRWGGVRVRLHALFFLFAILIFLLASRGDDLQLVWVAAMLIPILLLSVLLHEFAHAYAALRVGGRADEIVLGPLGGLTHTRLAPDSQGEWIVAIAGPLANLFVGLAVAPLLVLLGGLSTEEMLGLMHPLLPVAVAEGNAWWLVFLKLTFWTNWLLVIVNLLPAQPFDGGRALRAALRPLLGVPSAKIAVARVARITSLVLCVVAWFMRDAYPSALVPAWLPLVLIALFLFFSANQELLRKDAADVEEDDTFGYDFSQGFTSLERDEEDPPEDEEEPGLLRRWLETRRQEKARQQQDQEEAEERRLDEILAQLHVTGRDGLSEEDRKLLERVSERYRNRLQG